MNNFSFHFKDVEFVHPAYEKPSNVISSGNLTRFEYPDGVIVIVNHNVEGKMLLESNYGFVTKDGKTVYPNLDQKNSDFKDVKNK